MKNLQFLSRYVYIFSLSLQVRVEAYGTGQAFLKADGSVNEWTVLLQCYGWYTRI